MTLRWEEEAPRLAALARLRLAPEEAAALAEACDAITRAFSELEAYARGLPEPEPPAPGALRPDEARPPPSDEVEAILRAAPRVDPATRAVRVPRGLP
ncbi:MAG TPA: hypothetical protein VFH78_04095 [Candidatus Thermoplasmatota archaeon]|nr:hypothetical protein [Candidatus Thermoplasmatota archaeon]